MSKVDLHVHSTASDGRYGPEELVRKAAELGLTVIAIADHDSVDGIAPAISAAKAFPQLRVIPAVEISTDTPGGEVHLLGYFIDCSSDELKTSLARFRNSRRGRARKMVEKLENLGIHIDWQRVQEIAGSGSVGRPHVAQALLEKGYIKSLGEAFTKYIGQGGPAYAEREKMTPVEAVELVVRTGGLPVLAHPFTVNDPEALIVRLKASGLVGIEAYYYNYTAAQIKELIGLASKYNLIASGGSDYHGLDDARETMLGEVDMPKESAEQLISLAEQRSLKSANP